MTIKHSLDLAIKKLKLKKNKTAALDAEVLLAFILKKPKEFLYTWPDKKLTADQTKKFQALISRRTGGEPVAYLIKNQEFYSLDFYVDKRVLIPRPETELLIEEVMEYVMNQKLKIADIGTGSGCIAVALAKNLPAAKIIATDISKKALAVAKKNAGKHKAKIDFFYGNLLQPLINKKNKIDIIVANLPYLKKPLPFEPKTAFVGGKDGLEIYEKLIQQIANYKLRSKLILLEIDPRQIIKIKKIISKYLPQAKIEIKKDLAKLARTVVIKQT